MFSFRPKRILYRIILPFTLLFGLTAIFSWLCSAYFITHYIDQNLQKQMKQVAGILSRSGYILNPAVLRQLKEVINVDIVLFDINKRIFSSTIEDLPVKECMDELGSIDPEVSFIEKDTELLGVKYRTIICPVRLPGRGRSLLSLWTPTHGFDHLKGRIVFGIGIITLLGILAMAGAGYLIARTITSPVEELARVTARISGGDFSQRAKPDRMDEIGSLAESFNHMVDQLKAFEKKLIESEKLATAGQMIAGLTHEIRNPLTSIRMIGQVLQNRLKDQPENQEMLHSLVSEIDRLDRIIQQMNSKATPGELQRKWCDLNRQVEAVISVAAEGLASQKVTIEKRLCNGLPKVFIDEEKIKQVLWNLLLNAKEAMPKGGCLRFSTRLFNDQYVEVFLEDSGHGIAAGDWECLFQPFFTTKPEGMGLGLTMSRKIVEKHGGSLVLEGRSEGGIRAIVRIPIGEQDI